MKNKEARSVTCKRCQGKGTLKATAMFGETISIPCPRCLGTGKTPQ